MQPTVGDESWDISKSFAVFKGAVLGDIEGVHRGGRGKVAAVKSKRDTGVGHVSLVAIGRDCDPCQQ